MTTIDHQTAIVRIVKTLEAIVDQWPEVRARDLLECAKRLPAIIAELPLPDACNERAVGLYMENLVDMRLLPAWCGA